MYYLIVKYVSTIYYVLCMPYNFHFNISKKSHKTHDFNDIPSHRKLLLQLSQMVTIKAKTICLTQRHLLIHMMLQYMFSIGL